MNKEEIREKQEALEKELAELKQGLVKKDLAILEVIFSKVRFRVSSNPRTPSFIPKDTYLKFMAARPKDYFISIETLLNILSVASEGGL